MSLDMTRLATALTPIYNTTPAKLILTGRIGSRGGR